MQLAAQRIDDYSSSMFRFERLHDGWIDRCAAYLRHIFGERIAGATVIDYAFGRGNWSVAFVRAGARKVYAIDASRAAVERFSTYCAANGLAAVEPQQGNLMEAPLGVTADIVWAYGILPCIDAPDIFIPRLAGLAAGEDARLLAYAYDRHSLREFLVDTVRRHASYDSEAAFRAHSLKFTPAGRLRARDDLTAPHVAWDTAAGLAARFAPSGFAPVGQFPDFRTFDSGYADSEFAPHHLLLARSADPIALVEPARPYAADIEVLRTLWDACESLLSGEALTDLAISAFNTHFSHLKADGDPGDSVVEHALLLFYALKSHDAEAHPGLTAAARSLLALGEAALADGPRPAVNGFDGSAILGRLRGGTVRI